MPYEFRETIRAMIDRNAGKFDRWLNEVAEGSEKKGIPPDPAAALNILAKLAEYAAPKMTRAAVDENGNELAPGRQPVTRIAIQFVDGRAPSAIDTAPILEAPAQAQPERLAAIPAVQIDPPQRIKREKRTT